MALDVEHEVRILKAMTVGELRAKYRELDSARFSAQFSALVAPPA